jgi:hypothetical protein
MDLLGLALSLSLPMSGGQFTGDYSFDLSPTVRVDAPTHLWGAAATTFPGVVLTSPEGMEIMERAGVSRDSLMHHEMQHVRQMEALGPAFWAAYALSGGTAFEPHGQASIFPSASWDMHALDDYSRMWMPDDSTRGRYPLFRMAREGGGTRLQFMPGYPELLRLGNE